MPLSFDDTAIAFQYRSNAELKKAHFLFSVIGNPTVTKIGTQLTSFAFKIGLPIKGIVKNTIYNQFCGGETLDEVAETARKLKEFNVGVALDYSVEGKESEEEFDNTTEEILNAIKYAAQSTNIPFVPIKVTGLARFSLLEKIHNHEALSESEEAAWQRTWQRVDKVCAFAASKKIMILVDAEETWIQEPLDIISDAMMDKYNRNNQVVVFNTYQLYLKSRLSKLKEAYTKATQSGYVLGAKLVRGAYMEKERARAAEMQYPSPVQDDKNATDADFNAAVLFCLEHIDHIATFIGTHNENSCMLAVSYMVEHNIPAHHRHVYLAQLYGMSDNITFNLANAGYNASKYLPYGPVKDVMPYLMRRAQENTSVKGQTGRELGLIKRELKRRKIH